VETAAKDTCLTGESSLGEPDVKDDAHVGECRDEKLQEVDVTTEGER